ncbi:hypothetical protein [Apibacter adventoris]|uniref:hypothetical protein n=1 Tax=Apibacter adventoris TaxID=1679466 RepID=UPI0011B0F20D|nr:hypothetical protein [Apibacter adventoris]
MGLIGFNNLDEINIDNDRLWQNFKTFLFSMPDMISQIVGHKDDNPNELYYSDYQEKYKVYSKLEEYECELVQDGFLKFGVIHLIDNYLEEVFIHNAKLYSVLGKG